MTSNENKILETVLLYLFIKNDLIFLYHNYKRSRTQTIINLDLFLCMTCHIQLASTETQAVIEASVMIARNNVVAKRKRDSVCDSNATREFCVLHLIIYAKR